METQRQQKVARLLERDLADIFQKEGRNIYGNAFVTITKINISKDLSLARINISIFSADKAATFETIQLHIKYFRKLLGDRIKNQLRIVPNLEFYIDDSLDRAMKIEELLKH